MAMLLSACAQSSFYTSPTLPEGAENRRIVIMPIDVELSELTAAGLAIPKADWTATAQGHISTALASAMAIGLTPALKAGTSVDRARAATAGCSGP